MVGPFVNGIAIVKIKNKCNYINADGTLISDQWFDWIDYFCDGFARVKLKGEGYNYLKLDGTFLTKELYDECYCFLYGLALVAKKDKGYNYIDINGEYVKEWEGVYDNEKYTIT